MNLTKAKAYVALVGAVATGLLGVYGSDSTLGKALTVIAAVATGVATWRVPNTGKGQGGFADVGLVLLVATFVGVVLLLFRVHFR